MENFLLSSHMRTTAIGSLSAVTEYPIASHVLKNCIGTPNSIHVIFHLELDAIRLASHQKYHRRQPHAILIPGHQKIHHGHLALPVSFPVALPSMENFLLSSHIRTTASGSLSAVTEYPIARHVLQTCIGTPDSEHVIFHLELDALGNPRDHQNHSNI